MNVLNEELGRLLKELRKKQGLTQSELASRLFIDNHQRISRWESGKREPSLEDLAHLLFELGNETLIIKDKQIKIGEIEMTKVADNKYEKFMEFKYSDFVKKVEDYFNKRQKNELDNYESALKLAEQRDIALSGLDAITPPYTDANENYPETVITVSAPNRRWESEFEVGVANMGCLSAEAFDFFRFLEDVEEKYSEETLIEIRKAVILECLNGAGGNEVFNYFMYHQDFDRLAQKCFYLNPFKEVFNDLCAQDNYILTYHQDKDYNTCLHRRDFNYVMLFYLGLVDERINSRWAVCCVTDYEVQPLYMLDELDVMTEEHLLLGDAIADVIENYEEYKEAILEYLSCE